MSRRFTSKSMVRLRGLLVRKIAAGCLLYSIDGADFAPVRKGSSNMLIALQMKA